MFLILALDFVMKRPFLLRRRWKYLKEMLSKDTNRKFFRTVRLNTGHMYPKNGAEEIASKSHVPVHKKLDEVAC